MKRLSALMATFFLLFGGLAFAQSQFGMPNSRSGTNPGMSMAAPSSEPTAGRAGVNPSNPQDLTNRGNPQDLTLPRASNPQDLLPPAR
jgi:hypothetical protein